MQIKKPPEFVHPNKRKRTDRKSKLLETNETIQKPSLRNGSASANERNLGKSELIRLVVYPPVKGQIEIYDRMIEAGFVPKRALLGLLKKGFQEFEVDLLARNIVSPANELQTDGKPVDTTRNVSPQFINYANALFDPFDVLSDRALGRCIAETILRRVDTHQT